MPESNIRYWLQTVGFPKNTGKETERIMKGLLPNVFPFTISLQWVFTPTIENSSTRTTFWKKPRQMHITQFPDLNVTYCEGFNINFGNKNRNVVDGEP